MNKLNAILRIVVLGATIGFVFGPLYNTAKLITAIALR